MDTKFKKNIVLQNNYICKVGYLQNKTNYTSYKNQFNNDYNVGIPIKFCDVFILKLHPLVIAKEFCNCNLNPVIVNLVTEKYSEHNIENLEGVYDEILNLRTNFQSISKQNNNFPPKENEVIYTPQVMVIRDETLNLIQNFSNIFKVSFITISSKPELYKIFQYYESTNDTDESNSEKDSDDSEESNKDIKTIMSVETYLAYKSKIELILQTAHYAGNQVVIFNDFGCLADKIPIDDFTEICNSCILKYGHLFHQIVFAINVRTPVEQLLFEQLLNNIIRPQEIIKKDSEEDQEQDKLLANIIIKSSSVSC